LKGGQHRGKRFQPSFIPGDGKTVNFRPGLGGGFSCSVEKVGRGQSQGVGGRKVLVDHLGLGDPGQVGGEVGVKEPQVRHRPPLVVWKLPKRPVWRAGQSQLGEEAVGADLVWESPRTLVFLLGYDVLPIPRELELPFRVIVKEFVSFEQARRFVIKEWLARLEYGKLGFVYLLGMSFEGIKQPQGGDRRSEQARRSLRPGGLAAEALKETFGYSLATLYRADELVEAVHAIIGNTTDQGKEEEVGRLLLCRQSGLSREGMLALAQMDPPEQRKLVNHLMFFKKLPRGWRGSGKTITVPREVGALARALFKRLSGEEVETLAAGLLRLRAEQKEGAEGKTLASKGGGTDFQ
jgi:hypothetical protein